MLVEAWHGGFCGDLRYQSLHRLGLQLGPPPTRGTPRGPYGGFASLVAQLAQLT